MSTPDGHLIRQAFLTKYGYSPDLTYQEILREFQKRYDLAQELRQQHAGLHKVILVIEGMDEGTAHEAALREREVRKLKMARLTAANGFGITELDQLVEGYAARLEAEWIQQA
jgi:hypothetical protein